MAMGMHSYEDEDSRAAEIYQYERDEYKEQRDYAIEYLKNISAIKFLEDKDKVEKVKEILQQLESDRILSPLLINKYQINLR